MANKNYLCAKDECTLCMACANICPKKAIHIEFDKFGYEYVKIDEKLCVECGLCGKICERRNEIRRNSPIKTFAAQMKQKDDLRNSASGGAFQAIANWVLDNQGSCFGCYGRFEDGKYVAEHIRITEKRDLHKILNSKYMVSIIGNSYQQVRTDLENNKWVLFCGTPCQALGLKAYLNKDYKTLIVADIICHGVTSSKIFNDYINAIEKVEDIHITSYTFRDKTVCWGTNYKYTYINKNGTEKEKKCPREESSYMAYYLSGILFREKCYKCTLASIERIADITLGDFWGIECTHPELADRMSFKKGVSCVLANTDKGVKILNLARAYLLMKEVDLESIVSKNGSLRSCSHQDNQRDDFMAKYYKNGYEEIELAYRKNIRKKQKIYRLKNNVKAYMPDWMRIWLYKRFVK